MKYIRKHQQGGVLSGPIIGGKKYPKGTVVTNDPNDPRLQAFKDSTDAYYVGLKEKYEQSKLMAQAHRAGQDVLIEDASDYGFYDTGIFPTRGRKVFFIPDKNNVIPNGGLYGGSLAREFKKPVREVKYVEPNAGRSVKTLTSIPQNVTYPKRDIPINRIIPKGMPIPTVTPNQGIRPDVIYTERPDGHYKQGLSISHRTDPLGRWVADIHSTSYPGIKGRLTSFPNGTHKTTHKYQGGGWLPKIW